jgi:aryl-alcohol dehydrogenase-like predicted oxidoreductase
MFDEVSCIIPGASKPEHLDSNFKALEVPQISEEQLKAVKEVYEKRIKPLVHYSW